MQLWDFNESLYFTSIEHKVLLSLLDLTTILRCVGLLDDPTKERSTNLTSYIFRALFFPWQLTSSPGGHKRAKVLATTSHTRGNREGLFPICPVRPSVRGHKFTTAETLKLSTFLLFLLCYFSELFFFYLAGRHNCHARRGFFFIIVAACGWWMVVGFSRLRVERARAFTASYFILLFLTHPPTWSDSTTTL